MFKKESFKSNKNEEPSGSMRQLPVYREARHEVLRAKRCNSNNSTRNRNHFITAIDNFIHKLNDRRKTIRVQTPTYSSSDSQSSSSSSSVSSDSSSKNQSDFRRNEIKAKIKDSPKLLLKSTQNYIRSLKHPQPSQPQRPSHHSLKLRNETNDLYFDHFNSNRLQDLEDSSILKSLLDSQQYLRIRSRLSQSNAIKYDESTTSSSSENTSSNTSCIIHDYSDDSDCNSNQTFVEHADVNQEEEDVPYGWTVDYTRDGKKYYIDHVNQITHWDVPKTGQPASVDSGYNDLLAKLDATYLKSPNSIVNKVQIPDWLIELSHFSEENIQWESLDLKSLELYELMLQRIHKCELMDIIEKHEKYRAKLNEILVK